MKNIVLKIGFLFLLVLLTEKLVQAQIIVKSDLSPDKIVEKFIGDTSGILIKDVVYTGSDKSIGVFTSNTECLPIKKGIVLTTGIAEYVSGTNYTGNMGSMRFTPGNSDLDKIAKNYTADASVLEFVFYPNTNKISFNFFFASEEYPEFVNKGVNDVFAFFISGKGISGVKNIAKIPNTNQPITVDNINSKKNSSYFIENKIWNSENLSADIKQLELSYAFQFDGLTTLLEASADVIPYQPYKLKIAIADVGDNIYDSGVFLEAESFKSRGDAIDFISLVNSDIKKLEQEGNVNSLNITDSSLLISTNVQFEFNSDKILPEYYYYLDNFADILLRYFDLKIAIIGHTDNVGTNEYNIKLSLLRAKSVKNYLVGKGINEKRLRVVGKGNAEPVSKGVSETDRLLNRRVEFVIER